MNISDVAVVAGDLAAAAGLGWWFFGPKPAAEAVVAGGFRRCRSRYAAAMPRAVSGSRRGCRSGWF
jgi:hypothetical protein